MYARWFSLTCLDPSFLTPFRPWSDFSVALHAPRSTCAASVPCPPSRRKYHIQKGHKGGNQCK
ncbi:hypothetical protein E2C01_037576 [Portunus trituberculatus]|uniref:Uncharacterized protein n=1 Tax=Portunus trituberculatus TaxID=210409 RepID=A0A5B7FFB2_PORTR|nr:hypothetical protein [Portunus trituberculatus]